MEPVHWNSLELEPYRPIHRKRELSLGQFSTLIEWKTREVLRGGPKERTNSLGSFLDVLFILSKFEL